MNPIKEKKKKSGTDNSMGIATRKGWVMGRWKRAKAGINGGRRNLTLGGKCTVRDVDGVLWSCALETCMVLSTNVTPINLIRTKKKKKKTERLLITPLLGLILTFLQNKFVLIQCHYWP